MHAVIRLVPSVRQLLLTVFLKQVSLNTKRFTLVSEHRKTEDLDFRFWPRGKWNESQKMKERGGNYKYNYRE